MARNVAHTITFTFQGIDQLTPIASKVSTALAGVTKAFNSMASKSRYAAKQGPALQAMMAQLQGIARTLATTLQPVANSVAAANVMLGNSIDGVSRSAVRGKGSLKELAGAYNALIVVKHAARIMAGAVKPAMDLETAQTNLRVATGLSTANIERLTLAAMKAAEYTTFTPPEALEAAKRLNLAVRDTTATVEAMTPVLMLAQTFLGKDVNKAADLAATTMGAFRLQASELEPALNKLVAGSRAVGVQVADLEAGMGKLGVAAGLVGSNLEDILPAYLNAVKGGLTASEAATGLKTALGRLSDPKIIRQLEAGLGVTVAQGGAFTSVRDIMVGLSSAAQKHGNNWTFMANQIRMAFGDRAVKPIMTNIKAMTRGVIDQNGVLRTGAEAYDFVTGEMQASGGLLRQMNEEAMKPLSFQIERLTESLNNLLATVFAPFAGVLSSVVKAVGDMVTAFREFLDTPIGMVLKFLLSTFGNLAGVLMVVLGPILAVRGVLQIVAVAMNFLGLKALMATPMIQGLTARLQLFFIQAGHAAGASTLLGRALRFLGSSGKAAWAGLLGPIGLILAVIEYLPAIKKLWRDVGWLAAEKVVKEKEEVSTSAQIYARTIREADAIQARLGGAIKSFEYVIQQAKEVEKAKLPVAPSKILEDLTPHLEKLRRSGRFSTAGLALMEEQIATIGAVRAKYAAGKPIDDTEMEKAKLAMNSLNLKFKAFFPQEMSFVKGMDEVSKAFEKSLHESGMMSAAMVEAGYDVDKLKTVNDEKVKSELERGQYLLKEMAFYDNYIKNRLGFRKMGLQEFRTKAGAANIDITDWAVRTAKELQKRGLPSEAEVLQEAAVKRREAAAELQLTHPTRLAQLRTFGEKLAPHFGIGELVPAAQTVAQGPAAPAAPSKPEEAMLKTEENTRKIRERLEKGPLVNNNVRVMLDGEEIRAALQKEGGPGRRFGPGGGGGSGKLTY